MEFIKTAKPGKGLDYHPNLGMTENEWQELGEMGKQMKMTKTDVGFINISQTDSIIEITGSGNTEGLDGIKINLKTKRISTDYNSWDFTEEIEENEHQDKTGMWNGYKWKYQQIDTSDLSNFANLNGLDYNFSIGQLKESKKGIILFKAREFSNGQQYRMADLLVTYMTPKK